MNRLKIFSTALITAIVAMAFIPAHADAYGFGKEKFQKEFYFAHTQTGNHSGSNAANAHAIATDATFWAIPANTLIEKVYMILDVAITGTTVINVGDTDTAAGYCPTASITLATPAMYCWDAKSAGSYLRIQTAGVTSPADIFVVPNAKLYTAAGKYLTFANTTTNTAGSFRLVVEGYNAAP